MEKKEEETTNGHEWGGENHGIHGREIDFAMKDRLWSRFVLLR